MQKNFQLWLVGILLVMLVPFLFMSCQKKVEVPDETPTELEDTQTTDEEPQADELKAAEEQKRLEEEAIKRAQQEKEQAEKELKLKERNEFMSEDIHFEFDDYSLTAESQEVLKQKASYLNANPKITIIIEGHCDERGTTEYNLALGDRRAESARGFLIDLGVDPSRITKISYGEEMPSDPGHNEEAWKKNRRAHCVIE